MGKKIIKKIHKDAIGLTTAGIGMGMGMSAMSSVGADTKAVSNISSKMPMMGKMMGAGAVMGSTKMLMPKKKKKMMF